MRYMRYVAAISLAACAAAFATTLPAHAVGFRHPFCMQGNDSPGLSNCTFDSYEQCAATASGRFLYCIANPFFGGDDPYAYPSAYPAYSHHRHHRSPRYY